jgi:phosphate transport system permease protein
LPPKLAVVFRTIIEMLAAIPSVVFGLWGIFVVIPAIRPVANWLNETLGWIPVLRHLPQRTGAAAGDPGARDRWFSQPSISQDALNLVPYRTKEAAYGIGATRWEAILKVMLPTAAGGIFSAMVLGFGRALGETMALAMLIGNSNRSACRCSRRRRRWRRCWRRTSLRPARSKSRH